MAIPHEMCFADLLRAHRNARGLSQEELAEKAGLSRRGVSDLERDVIRSPYRHTVARLAEALQLTDAECAAFEAAARSGRIAKFGATILPSPSSGDFALPRAAREVQDIAKPALPIGGFLGATPAVTLVGRAQELAVIASTLAEVTSGLGRLLLLKGEPGVGKTRLAQEISEQARAGDFHVLTGRCYEPQQTFAYFPFREALVQAMAGSDSTVQAQMSKRWPEVLSLLPHQLLDQGASAQDAVQSDDRTAQLRLFWQVSGFLQALAEQTPLALLLDDIHWADSASLDLLQHLARRTRDQRILLVGTYRDAEVGRLGPLADALSQLDRDELTSRVTVRRLAAEETTALIGITLGAHEGAAVGAETVAPQLAQLIYQRSEGNAFFTRQLARALQEQGALQFTERQWILTATGSALDVPESVRAVIGQRLSRLAPLTQDMLREASVLGQVFAFTELQRLGKRGEQVVEEAIEEAVGARIVREGEHDRYHFNHALTVDTLYSELSAYRKRRLHQAAGEIIEQLGERERRVAELAYHFAQTDQHLKAVEYSIQAAERAHDAGARREEAALLAQALDAAVNLSEHALVTDLHEKRGKALIAAALWVEGVHELEAALGSLAGDQSEKRIAILLALANGCYFSESEIPDATQRARAHASEALLLAEGLQRDDLAARAISELAIYDTNDGLVQESQVLFERAFARAGADRVASLLPALDQYGLNCYYLGAFAEADRHTRHALDIARTTHDSHITVRTLGNLGMTLTGSGRYDEALAQFAEARRLGQEFRTWHWLARAISMCAGLYLALGDYAMAESVTEEARQVNQMVHFPNATASTGVDLLLTYARRHDPDRAVGLLPDVEEAVAKTVASHHWLLRMRFAQAQAEVALARGAPEEALPYAQDGIAQARQRGRVKYEVLGMQTHAQALAALGHTKEAIAELRAAVERARPVGDPAMFLRAAAALLAIEGDDALLTETHATVERIKVALPDELRLTFVESEPVRLVTRLSP